MTRKLYIDGGINYDVENKAGVQILSSLPITSPMGSNEGSIEIDSNWTKFRVSFFYMHAVQKSSFSLLLYLSSVERVSPKPNVVGSNPTERDSVLVMSNPKKRTYINIRK